MPDRKRQLRSHCANGHQYPEGLTPPPGKTKRRCPTCFPARPCSVEGCGHPARTAGALYCNAHYQRNQTFGSPTAGSGAMRRRDPALRFWPKVDKDGPINSYRPELGPCWVWTGAIDTSGYGSFGAPNRSGGKGIGTHVFAYQELCGPIPDGLELDHLCRVQACCNPEHLEPVEPIENNRRGMAARRATGGYDPGQRMRARTHCPQGHPYSADNTYRNARGYRRCRTCTLEANRRRYLRNIGRS